MLGSFLLRALVLAFGYAYPAYECFKTVEKNKPEIEQLLFWCQYWIIVAIITVCERVGDILISWLPLYGEAKLVFFIFLWHPKTQGSTFVYNSFFRPYVAKHETEIDRNILELRVRAWDFAVVYWEKVRNFGQTWFVEILQYVSSQARSDQQRHEQGEQTTVSGQSDAEACNQSTDENKKSTQQKTIDKEAVRLRHGTAPRQGSLNPPLYCKLGDDNCKLGEDNNTATHRRNARLRNRF